MSAVRSRRLRLDAGAPTLETPSDRALDEEAARRLWEVSEELTGVGFALQKKV